MTTGNHWDFILSSKIIITVVIILLELIIGIFLEKDLGTPPPQKSTKLFYNEFSLPTFEEGTVPVVLFQGAPTDPWEKSRIRIKRKMFRPC